MNVKVDILICGEVELDRKYRKTGDIFRIIRRWNEDHGAIAGRIETADIELSLSDDIQLRTYSSALPPVRYRCLRLKKK